jgi:uncharacterized protein YbjT (DUF2867 family)
MPTLSGFVDTALSCVGMTRHDSPRPPLAFVAGATGYTGQAVVRAARARGLATHAHVRPDSPALDRWRETFGELGAVVEPTPWNLEAMTETLARIQPTQVFALLGTTRKRGATDGGTYESVDYGLTAMLLDACLAAGLRPRFVYLSALGADPDGRPGSYLEVRGRFEQKLFASGLPYVVARPAIVTGADRAEHRPAERLGAVVGDALLGVAGLLGARSLATKYASTTADVLGTALVRLASDPAATSRVATGADLR